MALSDTRIRAAKPAAKGYRLPDGGGLHLFVTPNGVKSWRWRYEWQGKERTLVLGRYPDVPLADARSRRDDARRRLASGFDPAAGPEPDKAAVTFEAVARAWHDLNKSRWKAGHAGDVLDSLEAVAFPAFGSRAIGDVTPPMILDALRPLERRGAIDTARRIKQRISAVFSFAIGEGHVQSDPARDVGRAMAPMPEQGNRPAVATLEDARAALAAVEALSGHPTIKLAHRFLALTAQRPGEVGGCRWDELHGLGGPEPEWRIPAARMKMRRDQMVPLTPGALEVLETARRLTGQAKLVFPHPWDATKPLGINAIGKLMLRAGLRDRLVPHGWRATFSTIMNERRPADRDAIDLMLAHLPKDAVERVYNRAAHMPRRREIAAEWARLLLEGMPPAGDLLALPRRVPGA